MTTDPHLEADIAYLESLKSAQMFSESYPEHRKKIEDDNARIDRLIARAGSGRGETKAAPGLFSSDDLKNKATVDHPDTYLNAILDYSKALWSTCQKAGVPSTIIVDGLQHMERAARGLHAKALEAPASPVGGDGARTLDTEVRIEKACVRHLAAIVKLIEKPSDLEARAAEVIGLMPYFKERADRWRGIASAMGYEPNAHGDAKPTEKWIVDRIAKYRALVALASPAPMPGGWTDEEAAALIAEINMRIDHNEMQSLEADACDYGECCVYHDGRIALLKRLKAFLPASPVTIKDEGPAA